MKTKKTVKKYKNNKHLISYILVNRTAKDENRTVLNHNVY